MDDYFENSMQMEPNYFSSAFTCTPDETYTMGHTTLHTHDLWG